ncbi:glycoside hydrolase family 127 protein [Streptomyces sp. NBC_01808]|uniref:beta-L-arabinofuranosidase domain-containing protein n=1 Tax=Streptomyces sp. NBC_01808 TaxID=2975947 RepID=UPI002DDBECCC|nr:beta-L-arabinofuranosidase domain-containing protein [Streptomyces sp. NBC_01808]WSA35984.1 glycoside hydrolase family 127 protein [Streptomyces sp. NBC_01808]
MTAENDEGAGAVRPLRGFPADRVSLLPDLGRVDYTELPNPFGRRQDLVRAYLMSLGSGQLLRSYVHEAGIFAPGAPTGTGGGLGGWEALGSQLRGHFLGHWLSAAARIVATTGDAELRARAEGIVDRLAWLQRENGGEWVFSIPEKYLHRIAAGKPAWAPHYTVHKTLMGLLDAYRHLGSATALDIVVGAARWFHRWTGGFTRRRLDDLLDHETGGMLEVWAELYGITGEAAHLELVHRYDRPRLFDRLLAGEDPLTNRHANTTVPEALGAARAYEVTGEERWRRVAEAYWRCAVTARGTFATGGQTSEEVWTPPHGFAARLGLKTQEHCTVYNMMRLADVLLRWTGDPRYADYLELNLYNGVLAQQHPRTGMAAYYLPLRPGAQKKWGTAKDSFWCCYGTMVQAHTLHNAYAWYAYDGGVALGQYVPSTLRMPPAGDGSRPGVEITQRPDPEVGTHIAASGDRGARSRPRRWVVEVTVRAERPAGFELALRVPEWVAGPVALTVNGESHPVPGGAREATVRRVWDDDTVRLELPRALRAVPLPDRPESVAFRDGPVVLAGLCDEERRLCGNPARPETILVPDEERDPFAWRGSWRARGQDRGLRFVPLHEVEDESYAVYFPVTPER